MFLDILENLCKEKGATITGVLKDLKLSPSKGTAWRNGSIPNGEVLSKLADYFDVSTDYLLGRTPYKRPSDDPSIAIGYVTPGMRPLTPEEYEEVRKYADMVIMANDAKKEK